MNLELSRWLGLMERLQLPPSQDTYRALLLVYTAPERHYHNALHVARCLAQLDGALAHIAEADPIELALWFHDAVYDSHAEDNEAKSAAWADRFLHEAGAPPQLRRGVVDLILATRHLPGERSEAEKWIADIDLSSLGSEPSRFWQDNRAIRQEYGWVEPAVYREKRSALLRRFLERPAIYATKYFQDRYEAQARENLREAIRRLEAETCPA